MVIHNATFMVELREEGSLISWLRSHLPEMGELRSARLSAMREAGGVECAQAEAQSLAFQCEFNSEGEALEWRAERFKHLADGFMDEFGPNAMVFTSIFEIIPI